MTTHNAALIVADLALMFGRVERVTLHPDGKRQETDTDHTVMLTILACSLATNHPEFGLDVGLVAQLATVHDLPEARAGDTPTFAITRRAREEKEQRELVARVQIAKETRWFPWIGRSMAIYEAGITPEARFVHYLDKVMPRLTHALNGGVAVRMLGVTRSEYHEACQNQIRTLASMYPEFGVVHDLLVAASEAAEVAAYGESP